MLLECFHHEYVLDHVHHHSSSLKHQFQHTIWRIQYLDKPMNDFPSSYCFHLFSIFLKTAAAAAKSLQLCLTLCNPIDGSPPGSLSLGFSRQEYWSGLPFLFPMHTCMLSHFSRVQFCATLWTAAHQAPLSTGFSRQEHWSGLPFPSPINGIKIDCMNTISVKVT